MTTIACHFHEGVMVSDSKTTDGDIKWPTNKIERIRGSLFGAAGDCGAIEQFFKWMRAGGKGKKPQITADLQVLELNEEGVWLWDKKLSPFPAGREYHAVGSGAKAVLAAFLMGADTQRAVQIACEVDDGSEGPLQVKQLKENHDTRQ